MKVIVLAAGQGKRLMPLTKDIPKCMVQLKNKPLINYLLDVFKSSSLFDITVVGGYKFDILRSHLATTGAALIENEKFDITNMVSTLFCAEDIMSDDLIISYSDIVYEQNVLDVLMASDADFSVVVDNDWQKLWNLRQENILDDAETMKINDGKIIELGKKPESLDEIQAQYIGLIKISKNILPNVIDFYKGLNKNILYDGKSFDNMYMTTFIQLIIDNLVEVKPVYINGGWLEVDTVSDLNVYESNCPINI